MATSKAGGPPLLPLAGPHPAPSLPFTGPSHRPTAPRRLAVLLAALLLMLLGAWTTLPREVWPGTALLAPGRPGWWQTSFWSGQAGAAAVADTEEGVTEAPVVGGMGVAAIEQGEWEVLEFEDEPPGGTDDLVGDSAGEGDDPGSDSEEGEGQGDKPAREAEANGDGVVVVEGLEDERSSDVEVPVAGLEDDLAATTTPTPRFARSSRPPRPIATATATATSIDTSTTPLSPLDVDTELKLPFSTTSRAFLLTK